MVIPAIVFFVLFLLVLVALAGGFFFYIYWVRIQRPVPTLTGDALLESLDAAVEVVRDKHAIPHIYADSSDDLWRAQGYIHAQERFWQMEQARRTAYGTMSELFGEAALDVDRFSRILGFGRAAQLEAEELDAATRQTLVSYAEGVNAFLRHHPRRVAAELNLLRVTPDEWSIVDSVALFKVFAWSHCINWESELTRLRLVRQLGAARAADLEPQPPHETPVVLEGLGSDAALRMLDTAGLLLNQYDQIKGWFGVGGEGQGSNSWVVAADRSLNGRPLLAADPHGPLQIPGLFFENHLVCNDPADALEVGGASIPGLPGVYIGHNQEVAWGLTNAMVDVQDLFVEQIDTDRPGHFVYADGVERGSVRDEEIRIRRRAPHVERVIESRHGPVISRLLHDQEDGALFRSLPLAVRWAGFEPGTTLRAVLQLNRARTPAAIDAALADWCEPPVNVTFADSAGNIGYRMAGRIPLRREHLGLTPAAGWLSDGAGAAFIPRAELPRLDNPASGIIVTANNKVVGDDYPYFLGIEFMPGWRAARIEEMLGKKKRHTIRDMEEIQQDTGSKFAEALAPWFGLLYSDDPWEKAALDAIRTWNYRMEPDSTAALVFHYALLHLLDMTFGEKIGTAREGYTGITSSPVFPAHGFVARAELRLLQLVSENEESVWYTDAATGESRTRDELLQAALSAAVKRIRATVGDSTRKWDWGRSHQIRYVHSLGSARFLRGFFNRGPFPIGGDGSTPLQTRHAPDLPLGLVQITPAYRQIFEVGAWDRGETVVTSGQSGHPLSDHYDDQITMFREGVYHRMPWSRAAVQETSRYRMQLRPRIE